MDGIRNLSHIDLRRLHKEGQISVRANMSAAMRLCDNDPRIPTHARAAHLFWKWLGLLMLIGGPISIFFISWYWSLLIFFGSFMVMNATRQSAGQFLVEAVLEGETLYLGCLYSDILLIRSTSSDAPNI